MEIRNAKKEDLITINRLFNEQTEKEFFYKPIKEEDFLNKMHKVSLDGVFIAVSDKQIVGFIIGYINLELNDLDKMGYINIVLVKEKYQNLGVEEKLINSVEEYFSRHKIKTYAAGFWEPFCYSWYIPNTLKHDHPCTPGIRINSNEYIRYLKLGYEIYAVQDAFYLSLAEYELSKTINTILEENKKEGFIIELYDSKKHHGLDEFYKDIEHPGFEKSIRYNLSLENPNPFLVVTNDSKEVLGWTGAMWNESSGRAHFDGIVISPKIRGRGLGKALFALLAQYSKQNGASFMTFYTGLTNHARYIYLGAGFKIAKTFALMKKKVK